MKGFTLTRKAYETPESEVLVVLLEPLCQSPDDNINPMEEPEDL